MKITTTVPPASRAEFEERINHSRENMKNGMVKFAPGLRGPDSLLRMRYLPNGRVDFLSIDETARSHINTTFNFRTMAFGAPPLDDEAA